MKVNGHGCLQCGKAPSTCIQIKGHESDPFLEGEPVSAVAFPGLTPEPHGKANLSDCDGFVAKVQKEWPHAIPKSFQARPILPCGERRGPGLCCFFSPEDKGFKLQGFHFIEGWRYIYRVEYTPDDFGNYTRLAMVWRFCKSPDKCPGGDAQDDLVFTTSIPIPRFPKSLNTLTSADSSTNPPRVSNRPNAAATLGRRDILSSMASQNITGIPDLPRQTLSNGTPSSQASTSVSPDHTGSVLKIDLSKLNAPGLVDIMLAATNIEEVRHAQLNLLVKTECFTYKDGNVNCKEVIVELTGHRIGGQPYEEAVPDLLENLVSTPQEVKNKILTTSAAKPHDSIIPRTRTITVTKSTTSIIEATSTMTTTASTHKTIDRIELPKELWKYLRTPMPPAPTSTTPLPRFDDTAQAVLGPRAVNSLDELQEPVFSTVGYKSKTACKSGKLKKVLQTIETKV